MWYERHLQNKIKRLAENFKVIMIVGARQVGKSSLLGHLFPHLQHVTFDPYNDQFGAKEDPDQFLRNFPSPIILDEVQYVPQLLSAIKRYVDRSPKNGQYFLTGSQNFSLLKNAAESMAGRVAILELNGLTPFETAGCPEKHWLKEYLENPTLFSSNLAHPLPERVYEKIWRGSLPQVSRLDEDFISDYFSSYTKTYLERDVRIFDDISDMEKFDRFIRLCAALSAQEINDAEFGRDLGVSGPTIKRWRTRLLAGYQWMEIPPYFGNTIKRLTKKSKGYFCDTGLACHLMRIPSPLSLAAHPALGSLFESYCIRMISTLCTTLPTPPGMYHWRSNGGAEVDVILDYNGSLYPIEIKCRTLVSRKDARGIEAFRQTYPSSRIAPGLILYTGEHVFKVKDDVIVLPWNASLI